MKDFLKPAEIILIALLVALAMGIWSAVDSPLAETLRRIEPSEDEIQLEHEVPRLQSVAKANEDGLAATRAKVQELELELAQQIGGISNLVRSNSGLRALGIGESKLDSGSSNPGSVSPEMLQAYLLAQTELKVTRRLTERLESDTSRQILRKVELAKKLAAMDKGSSDALRVESELSTCQEQLLAVQKKLVETRLEVPRNESRLEEMASSQPRLSEMAPPHGLPGGLSPQALQSLAVSLYRQSVIEGQLQGLYGEVGRREQALIDGKSKLIKAQRAVAQVLNLHRWTWMLARSWVTFLASAAIVAILLVLVRLVLKKATALMDLAEILRPTESIVIAGSAILILFLYQGFQVLGAALGATVIFPLVTAFAVRAAQRERAAAADRRKNNHTGEPAQPQEQKP